MNLTTREGKNMKTINGFSKTETKNFICTCCKKSFIIPSFRWSPDRGAEFFSCDWKEKNMIKHKLCGECSDSVRKHLKNMEFVNERIKINAKKDKTRKS